MKKPTVFLSLALFFAFCGRGMAQDFLAPPETVPYTPILVSFAPMVSMPVGFFDTSASMAAVGALTRDVYGFMGAGVFNMARDIHGFQGAGVFNMAHDVAGFQGAGVFNMAGDVDGGQAAGVFNLGGRVAMFQAAGVFNIADDFAGFQGSGIFNIAGNVRGVQAAGLFNSARHVRGVQIGIINVATEVEGIQIGIINIARDGLGGPGVFFEPQTGFAYAYWQNGSRHLYTVLSLGAPLSDCFASSDRLVSSLGLGSRFGPRHGLHLDAEILAAQDLGPFLADLSATASPWTTASIVQLRTWPELRLRLGLPLGRRLEAVAGVTIDIDLSDAPFVPEDLRRGYSAGDTWFGESFTAYTRWFIGLKI